MSLSYLVLIGLISLLVTGCLSPIAITPSPSKPTPSAITSTKILTTPVATLSLMATSIGPPGEEAEETADTQCNVTPYTSDPPANDHMASFTLTWFRNEESTLWAGLAPPYEGKWYAGPQGLKVLWWLSEGTFEEEPLQVEGYQLEGKLLSMQAEIPEGYYGSFHASGLIFSESGCWKVTGKSGNRELTFIIWVNPAEDHPIK